VSRPVVSVEDPEAILAEAETSAWVRLAAAFGLASIRRELIYVSLSIFSFLLGVFCVTGPREFSDWAKVFLSVDPLSVALISPYLLLQVARLVLLLVKTIGKWAER
jgi:hypothetical protein